MTEKQITICGHGSGNPSLKNLYDYLDMRYKQWCTNGGKQIRKGLVAVRRLKSLDEIGRQKFHDTYKTILGRNIYSQSLREYCYKKYNGNYYSDCSSSGCKTFEQIGYNCPSLNTAGIYTSSLFETVPVNIENGHIMNPEILRVSDALLFAGSTAGRPLNISHVEFIYEMPSGNNDGWSKEGGDWYYYNNGSKLKKEWVKSSDHWYRMGNDGKMLIGWHKIYDKDGELRLFYFADRKDGFPTELEGALIHECDDRIGALEIWCDKP